MRSILSIASTVLFATTWAASFAQAQGADTVAINPRSGDNFVFDQTQANSPGSLGQLLILNDHQIDQIQSVKIIPSSFDPSNAKVHLDAITDHQISYGVSDDHHWYVGTLTQSSDGQWQALPEKQALQGDGQLVALSGNTNGTATAVITQKNSDTAKAILVKTSGSSLEVTDQTELHQGKMIETFSNPPETKSDEQSYASGDGVGFAGGWITGAGFAYRRYFENRFGIQVSAMIFGDQTGITSGDIGIEALYTLSKSKIVRFNLVAGAAMYYSQYETYISPDAPTKDGQYTPPTPVRVSSTDYHMGAGIGIEVNPIDALGIFVEVPLTVTFTSDQTGFHFNRIGPTISGGIVYYF